MCIVLCEHLVIDGYYFLDYFFDRHTLDCVGRQGRSDGGFSNCHERNGFDDEQLP